MLNIFLLWLGISGYPKYLLVFIGVLLANPVGQILAASAASLGYLNIFYVLIIAIIAEFLVDMFYFGIGRIFGEKILTTKFFCKKKKLIFDLNKKLHYHFYKTLIVTKLCGPFACFGFTLVGISRMKIRRVILTTLSITIIMNTIWILLGYYLGYGVNSLLKYLKIGEYSLIIIIILLILSFCIFKKFSKKND